MQVRQTIEGRYTLLDELGSGGMAVVWRARDEVLGRQVAVKVLAGRYADDPQSRARIRDEARAAATLSHPNIAQVYDYGEAVEDGTPRPYVVMELVNGPTLQQRVASGPLPPRTVFRVCGEVAAALAAAHGDGLVHRDIKMANIMVTPTGAKVVDFGIAAAVGPAAPEDMLVGTPAYLAPERLIGDTVLPASDVYALGVLLYRLLAHESPWSVEGTTQMLQAHIYVEPAPLPATPGVPPAIADLIGRCLGKDPAERPSASEVSATLADAAEAAAAVRARNSSPPAPGAAPAANRLDELAAPTGALAPERRSGRNAGASAARAGAGPGGPRGGRNAGVGAAAGAGADRTPGAKAGAGKGGNRAPAVPAPVHGPETAVAPAAAGRAVAVGGGGTPVHPERRRYLLAGGVAAALALGVSLAWPALSGRDAPGRDGAASPPSAAGPAVTGRGAGPAATGGADAGVPATTGPARAAPVSSAPAVVAGSPVPSAASASGTAGSAPPPSGSTDPSPSAAPGGTRLTSPGGTVYAVCDAGYVTLTSWEAAEGFAVEEVQPGPALAARIVFAGTQTRYRMSVTCVAGKPTPVVLPL